MSDLGDKAKDAAIGAAVGTVLPVVAKGFRGWMTTFALKRPNGLVARFRRFTGLQSDAEIKAAHDRMLEQVQKAVNEYTAKGK